ncbi:MAG: hypothetical protein PHQ35_00685 [Phycisphaerae bacterium]|nr:hypothetical protein [Phycisphaerae bacterium]MDD5381419.1 hypothetical protein [Phycisphaerae bacterium]
MVKVVTILGFIYNLFSGEAKFAFLIYFGIISFGVSVALAILIMMVNGFRMNRYMKNHHFDIWEIPDGKSFKKSAEYGKAIKSINDPALKEKSAKADKYAKSCLLVWFILFLLVLSIVMLLHMLGI